MLAIKAHANVMNGMPIAISKSKTPALADPLSTETNAKVTALQVGNA